MFLLKNMDHDQQVPKKSRKSFEYILISFKGSISTFNQIWKFQVFYLYPTFFCSLVIRYF